MHLLPQGLSIVVPMPEMEAPAPWPHTVVAPLCGCQERVVHGQCTSWLLKPDLEEQKGIWLRVAKELHGQSWSAGASLFLLKMESLSPLPDTVQ